MVRQFNEQRLNKKIYCIECRHALKSYYSTTCEYCNLEEWKFKIHGPSLKQMRNTYDRETKLLYLGTLINYELFEIFKFASLVKTSSGIWKQF